MSGAHGNDSAVRALLTGVWMVPSSGGAVKTIERFRRALDADAVSFTDSARLDAEGSAVQGAVHVRTADNVLGRKFFWAPKSARREADALAASCDLVTTHGLFGYPVVWVREWIRQRGIPYWVIPHGILDPYVYTYRVFRKRLFLAAYGRRHLRGAAHVIFSTRREMEKASAIYSGSNARVVNWPVDPIEISDRAGVRARIRAELGIPAEARVLIYLGRVHSMKRPIETIEAVARAQVPGMHLVVVGPEEGVTRAECEARAAAMGFAGLHMLGPVFGQRKDELLLASDAFISLSIRENFGHSAAEAISAGLPAILSPGNDLIGELTDVRCGWYLLDDRPDTAVGAIREFGAMDPGAMSALGQNGRDWVCRELSFATFQGKLKALAQEAVVGRKKAK